MAGAFLAVGEFGWRVTITGNYAGSKLPTEYMDKLLRFGGAIQILCEDEPCESEGIDSLEVLAKKADLNEGYVPWPVSGTVTSKEIAEAWVIGESTFKQKVYQKIYPQPLDVASMRKLWDVETVTKALKFSNVQRRRLQK